MSSDTGDVRVHMYVAPNTPSAGPAQMLYQIMELWEFGVLGPGSRVWCNIDIPNAMWVLSDRSSFLRVIDVPSAGWVRLSPQEVVWGRVLNDVYKSDQPRFELRGMPIAPDPYDTVTVAFRNNDSEPMRATFSNATHTCVDFEIAHRGRRAIDFKMGGLVRKSALAEPTEFDRCHAMVRGVELMSASTGAAMHAVIRENLDAFTTTIGPEDFERMRSARQRMSQATERIVDPIMQSIVELPGIGPFNGYTDEDAFEPEEDAEKAGYAEGTSSGCCTVQVNQSKSTSGEVQAEVS